MKRVSPRTSTSGCGPTWMTQTTFQDRVVDALGVDRDGDGFEFTAARPRSSARTGPGTSPGASGSLSKPRR